MRNIGPVTRCQLGFARLGVKQNRFIVSEQIDKTKQLNQDSSGNNSIFHEKCKYEAFILCGKTCGLGKMEKN